MVIDEEGQFLAVSCSFWQLFVVLYCSLWFFVFLGGSRWFLVILVYFLWFIVVLGDSWWIMVFFCDLGVSW